MRSTWQYYLTGLWLSELRLEESLVLSWDEDSPISVDLSGKRPRLRIYAEAEKGHRNRLLPVTPDFAEFLLATPESEREGKVFKVDGIYTGRSMTPKRVEPGDLGDRQEGQGDRQQGGGKVRHCP